MPKYSIILPVYNAEKYILASINTVLNINYQDFEFIISNNCSTDGTEEILNSIKDQRVKIIRPETTLPLGAHWNFAIKHASGDWLWAMGSDDGMMPYFFELCDKLIQICEEKNINVIKSNRAYYFWPGCEKEYKDSHINFSVALNFEIKKTVDIMNNMLTGKSSYFDIPQMYISSLFSKKLIDKAILNSKTGDIIPYNVPAQDAYLGVLACIFENKYLYIDVPLGWVGTSLSAFYYKAKNRQLLYSDCSYNALANQISSLMLNMHLAFRAFFDNSNFKTNKFKKITSYITILSRLYYQDLINLPEENSRVQTFFAYLKDLNIDKEQIVKHAKMIKKMDKLSNFIQRLLNIKPIRFIERIIAFFYSKLKNRKCDSWSISINNSCCLTYEQINSLLNSEQHVKEIIKQIS